MKQPTINSASSFTDVPVDVTEITEVSQKLSPTEGKIGQQSTMESRKHRKFPFRFVSKKQQPHSPQNNTDESHQVNSKPMRPSLHSIAEDQLAEIIKDLNENPLEKKAFEEKGTWQRTPFKWVNRSRRFIRHMMELPKFHYAIIILVKIDLIIVFIELTIGQLSAPCLTDEEMEQYNTTKQRKDCHIRSNHRLETAELALFYVSFIIICIFVLEILSALYAFGWRRYKKLVFLVDAFIVLTSFILEAYFHFGTDIKAGRASAALVVLRLWKVVRAMHAIAHSISLRNRMIIDKIKKAQEALQEDIRQAEKTIYEQKMKIDDLTALLEKNGIRIILDQMNGFSRTRSASVAIVTRF